MHNKTRERLIQCVLAEIGQRERLANHEREMFELGHGDLSGTYINPGGFRIVAAQPDKPDMATETAILGGVYMFMKTDGWVGRMTRDEFVEIVRSAEQRSRAVAPRASPSFIIVIKTDNGMPVILSLSDIREQMLQEL